MERARVASVVRRYLWCVVVTTMLAGGIAAARTDGGVHSVAPAPAPAPAAVSSPGAHGAASRPAPVGEPAAARSCPASGCMAKVKGQSRGLRQQISFRPPIDFATGAVPSSEAFNAANGDQLLPLTTAHATLSDSVAVADFNVDGRPDVAQTNVVAGSVSIFLGDGRGAFAKPVTYPVGVHPTFIAARDLDLDGRVDLVAANIGSNDLAILHGAGDGRFEPASFVSVPRPQAVAVGRFNSDAIPDLAVASGAPSVGCPATCSTSPVGGTVILTGARAADVVTYTPSQLITHTHSRTGRPGSANFVAVGDFDGSGRDDLAIGVGTDRSSGGQNSVEATFTGDDLLVFRNRNDSASQPFRSMPDQQIRVGGSPDAIAIGDWNGDTSPDMAVLNNGSGDITSLLGNSDGHFEVKANNVSVGGTPRSLVVGDFDGDGIHDLVTAHFGASTVATLRGNGDGSFQPAVDFWSGEAPTSVAAGNFDDDGRLDIVAGRLRTDQLSLLVNDSPQSGDGVLIRRDIPYGSPTHPIDDPFAARHTLDVYSPPSGTASFAGRDKPYPVVFFVAGGQGISGDKSAVSYLMRSLALDGVLAVSINYRLGHNKEADQDLDVAQAFRWTRDNVGSPDFGGDAGNLFVFGHSAGARALVELATDDRFPEERKSIRGLVLAGSLAGASDGRRSLGPSLLLTGTEGLELATTPAAASFAAASSAAGADSRHFIAPGRDHWTSLARLALADDLARVHLLRFLRRHLV